MTATITDDAGAAFAAALSKDAGVPAAPPEAPAPPRLAERDPAAPHGRDADGTPLAPYGTKQDGTPRIKPAGPGRTPAAAEDKPRVTAAAETAAAAGDKDYTADLMTTGMAVWVGASTLRGGRLLGVPIPDTRPYAQLWLQQLPQLAVAWNAAAVANPTVRRYVSRFAGDGSASWIFGVTLTTVGFVAAAVELAKAPAEVRQQLAERNDAEIAAFIEQQVQAAGLQAPEETS